MFYQIAEYFTVYGSKIEYDEETNSIKMLKDGDNTAYGNVKIYDDGNINCYFWKFKIMCDYFGTSIFIGLDSSNKEYIESDFGDFTVNRYKFCGCGENVVFGRNVFGDNVYNSDV